MKLVFLESGAFETAYNRGFVSPKDISREDLTIAWEALRERYRQSLSLHWTEDYLGEEDFAISDDWHCSFYHCGGSTSEKSESFEFLETIRKEIIQSSYPQDWLFHLTVGVNAKHEGEILIDHSGFYANSSRKFDYRRIQNRKNEPNQ